MDKKYLYEFKVEENTYSILKPTRKIRESSEDYHLYEINRLVKLGIMPLAVWQKKVNGKSEVTTDEERLSLGMIIKDIQKASQNLEKLNAIVEEDRTNEDHEAILENETNLAILEQKYQTYQTIESQSFSNTAEGKAHEKLVTWFSVFLTHKNGEAIFKGTTLDEKLDFAETIEDEELAAAYQRLKILILAWTNGRVVNFEEFEKLDNEVVEFFKKKPIEEEIVESVPLKDIKEDS